MKKATLLFVFLYSFNFINAQENTITTAVPFLMVAADARAAGMADNGVASSTNDFILVSPNEFAFDLSYSLKLSDKFAMAVAGRFINSNLKVATENNDSSSSS